MESLAQRVTIVIEHESTISDLDEGAADDAWYVATYLVHDSGLRERVTLDRCATRADASAALSAVWRDLKGARTKLAQAS